MFFFFNDTATTEIYTLSLHDALPIYRPRLRDQIGDAPIAAVRHLGDHGIAVEPEKRHRDRKSTRLNSSHANISYAVFCLKKKKQWASDFRISNSVTGSSTVSLLQLLT